MKLFGENMEIGYIGITFFVLLVLFIFFLFFKKKVKNPQKFSNLSLLGIALVVTSMFYNEGDHYIGYAMMGLGIIVTVIAALKAKKE